MCPGSLHTVQVRFLFLRFVRLGVLVVGCVEFVGSLGFGHVRSAAKVVHPNVVIEVPLPFIVKSRNDSSSTKYLVLDLSLIFS